MMDGVSRSPGPLRSDGSTMAFCLRFLAVVGITGALYATLLFGALGGAEGFWSGDQGVKICQIDAIVDSGFSSLEIDYHFESLDPEWRWAPFGGQFVRVDGRVYSMFPMAFALLAALFMLVFGPSGPYLATIVCGGIAVAAAQALAPRWDRAAAGLVAVAVGVGSPLLVNSLVLWEHAPAVALTTIAVLLGLKAARRGSARLALASGLAVGVAAWFRNEAVLFAPAIVVAWWAADGLRIRDRRLPMALGGGCVLGLALLVGANLWQSGNPLGSHVVTTLRAVQPAGSLAVETYVTGRVSWASLLIAPTHDHVLLAVSGVTVLLFILAGVVATSRWATAVGVGCSGALAVASVAAVSLRPAPLVTQLLVISPLVIASLAAVAPFRRSAEEAPGPRHQGADQRAVFLSWCGWAFVAMCVVLPLPDGGAQWGPRILLPAVPPLLASAVLVSVATARQTRSLCLRALTLGSVLAAIAAGSLLELQGARVLAHSKQAMAIINGAVRTSGAEAVVYSAEIVGSILAPVICEERPVFFAPSTSDTEALLPRLEAAGLDRLLLIRVSGASWPDAELRSRLGLTPRRDVSPLPFLLESEIVTFKDSGRVP